MLQLRAALWCEIYRGAPDGPRRIIDVNESKPVGFSLTNFEIAGGNKYDSSDLQAGDNPGDHRKMVDTEIVPDMILNLGCAERQLVSEYIVRDASIADIAENMGVEIATIRQRLYRIWKRVQNTMESAWSASIELLMRQVQKSVERELLVRQGDRSIFKFRNRVQTH